MTDLFESLLAPLDADTFFRDHFGKQYLHVRGTPERTADIMSLDRLNSLMSMTSVWTPDTMKLFLDQRAVETAHYCTPAPTMDGSRCLRPDPDMVQEWIAKGASVILNDIDALAPGVRQFANELQEATGGRSQANLYFSMNQHQAFGPHCDSHEVFAVHCGGEKTWNIYEGRDENPINHPNFKPSVEERSERAGKLADQVHMKAGDLLYIPRGRYHDALASQNGAIHIAFGVTLPKPLDLLPILWEAAVKHPWMRSDLRNDMSPQDLAEILTRMSQVATEALTSKTAHQVAAATIKNWPYEFKRYNLDQLVAGKGSGTAERDVVYAVSKQVKMVRDKGRPYLSDGKQRVEIPKAVSRQVDFIMARQTVTQAALHIAFPEMSETAVSELFQNMKAMRVIA